MTSYSVWFLTRPGSCHPISAASGGTQALNSGFQAFLALHGPTERQSEIWGVAEEKCAALCMEWPGCTAYEYKLGRWFVPPGPAPFFGPQGARGKWIGKGHASRCSIFNSDVSYHTLPIPGTNCSLKHPDPATPVSSGYVKGATLRHVVLSEADLLEAHKLELLLMTSLFARLA